MTAIAWSALGLLAAAVFGSFFYLGNRIDGLAARMDSRFDRMDSRFDHLDSRIDGLSARMDAHIDRHGPQRRAR